VFDFFGYPLFHIFGFIPFSVISALDILIVGFVFYRLLGLIRGTRAAQMLVGLFLLVTILLAARWQEMTALAFLLEQVRSILLILLVILFQPELRRMLVALGQSPILRWFYRAEPTRVIDELVSAAAQLSERGYGALIVVAREAGLEAIIESGVPLNSSVSADLLTTIFTPRSPLHDQAVVIQGESLVAARCTLPLAEEVEDQRMGTRHRAAVGVSQETDAVAIVVSEENQAISLTVGGGLARGLSSSELRQRLTELLTTGERLGASRTDALAEP
jgi:diadenylate cyclase